MTVSLTPQDCPQALCVCKDTSSTAYFFITYTDGCRSTQENRVLITFSDDTAALTLLSISFISWVHSLATV